MIEPIDYFDEDNRIKELYSYAILDSFIEDDYDNLVKMAASICEVPMSLITIVDKSRQWFKSCNGLDASETPRSISFCGHAINQPNSPLIVEDATKDERFHDNPLVIGGPEIKFYIGIPLVTENSFPLGTLCIADVKPRKISENQLESLKMLAKQVMNLLVLRKSQLELKGQVDQNVILLKEVHHRVKNNLQVVSSLLRLQSNEISDEKLKAAFKDSQDRIVSISKVHEILYQSVSLQTINLDEYITSLTERIITNMNKNKKDVSLVVNTHGIGLNLDTVIPIGLILNEIITNSMKYAFINKDIGEITIEFTELENELYKLEIGDDGIGIKDKFNTTHKSTLGVRLIKKLTQQLNGAVEIDTSKKGTHFIITFQKL